MYIRLYRVGDTIWQLRIAGAMRQHRRSVHVVTTPHTDTYGIVYSIYAKQKEKFHSNE